MKSSELQQVVLFPPFEAKPTSRALGVALSGSLFEEQVGILLDLLPADCVRLDCV